MRTAVNERELSCESLSVQVVVVVFTHAGDTRSDRQADRVQRRTCVSTRAFESQTRTRPRCVAREDGAADEDRSDPIRSTSLDSRRSTFAAVVHPSEAAADQNTAARARTHRPTASVRSHGRSPDLESRDSLGSPDLRRRSESFGVPRVRRLAGSCCGRRRRTRDLSGRVCVCVCVVLTRGSNDDDQRVPSTAASMDRETKEGRKRT